MQNMTPHVVVVLHDGGKVEIAPSGTVARVSIVSVPAGALAVGPVAVPVVTQSPGPVTGLPAQEFGCPHCGMVNCEHAMGNEPLCGCAGEPQYPETYLVSAMVRLAVPERTDVFSPGELLRGADGQPTGCRGLVGNGGGK